MTDGHLSMDVPRFPPYDTIPTPMCYRAPTRVYRCLAVFLFLISFLAWGTEPAIDSAHGESAPVSDSFLPLWSASSGGDTIYLLGSFHVARPDLYPLPAVMYQALSASDDLYVEVDITQIDVGENAAALMAHALLPDNQTLYTVLPKEMLPGVEELVESTGFGLDQFAHFQPWFIEQAIGLTETVEAGFEPELGIDLHFIEEAARRGIPIVQLETLEQQVAILSSVPLESQIRSLERSLRDTADDPTEILVLYDSWRGGNMTVMEEHLIGELKRAGLQSYTEIIFNKRNRDWIARILDTEAVGTTRMVVVGAGHMVGAEGLLQLLRDRGYEVRQLTDLSTLD